MKKIISLFLMLSPFAVLAQVDDIYFVPERETRVLVVRSTEEAYFVDADDYYNTAGEDVAEEAYFTNDLDDILDDTDYRYSSRIIRFRSPGRVLSTNLYWSLNYDCGINDWLVYDNGYSIDIYPTSINPLYWGGFNFGYSSYNYWNWHSWYRPSYWYDDCWHYHSPHYWHSNWPLYGYHGHGYGRPVKWAHSVPTMGSVANNRIDNHHNVTRVPGSGRPSISVGVPNRGDRGNNGVVADRRPGRNENGGVNNNSDRRDPNVSNRRQPQNDRTNAAQSGNTGNTGRNGRENGVRRQPQSSSNANVQVGNGGGNTARQDRGTGIRRQPQNGNNNNMRVENGGAARQERNTSVGAAQQQRRENGSSNVRQNNTSPGSRSSYSSRSSGNNSRPSSTSVTRTGGSSSSRSSMSSGGGSSSRSSSSGGGSSRSSSSGGGGSRSGSSGGGGSRSGGSRR